VRVHRLWLALLAAGCGTPATHWSYAGAADGPARWATLAAAYGACGHEHGQSPVELRTAIEPPAATAPRFDYRPSDVRLRNDGHGLQLLLRDGGTLHLGDDEWKLERIDIHRPGEHAVDGERTPLELQLVHRGRHGIAIVALFVVGGEPNPVLARLWSRLPGHAGIARAGITLDAKELLPDERAFDVYDGSLTTPPCTEGVRWIVLRNPISMSVAAIDQLAALVPENARPLQPR
jgi:carbonic anhydrase